ncbi:mandelate racemase/muconate lactonizing enzyme family protein [Sansalvadorimonas sp. 2012CJ34-2]|uniref:glucarate dehydratase n=1 Tax=Parendozoicomonas callyspongiae TaxID=2942213 RepID=A0ABT0PBG9_9GAMM|nr:mandelate racemase/muconate lactonizing enzyme family protein [Sansalvadorimonas sp. 2012CJ34-2]
MKQSNIKRIELYAVADRKADPVPWADDQEPLYYTNNIVRLITDDGLEGVGATISYTEEDFDKCVLEAMKSVTPGMIGKNALMTEQFHTWLQGRCTWGGLVAKSPFDIAAWDIKGKKFGMPIYMMLGGARNKMLSYASTPLFHSHQEYFDFIEKCIDEGFTAVKLHCHCVFEKDVPLVKAVDEHFKGRGIELMLDTAMYYNGEQSLKMAKLLDELGWYWYEAPCSDYDFKTYQKLVKETNIEISSHGNCLLTLPEVEYALANDMWSDVRQDATVCGGITPLNKCFAIAEAHGKPLEIQSWGYTITQAANLHVALAHNNGVYFEQAFPYENFEYGAKNVIRTDKEGFVHAPEGDGLGVEMDWAAVRDASILSYIIE